MADISSFLKKILEAIYGEEVRGSIHDALAAMNKESSSAMEFAATAKDSAKASAEKAKNEADTAGQKAAEALDSAGKAAQSETNAKASETAAEGYADLAVDAAERAGASEKSQGLRADGSATGQRGGGVQERRCSQRGRSQGGRRAG